MCHVTMYMDVKSNKLERNIDADDDILVVGSVFMLFCPVDWFLDIKFDFPKIHEWHNNSKAHLKIVNSKFYILLFMN